MMRFYLNRGGAAEGPLEEAAILSMIASRELTQGYICAEGGQAWVGLDSHPPFASALAGGAPPMAAQPMAAQPMAQSAPFGAQAQHTAGQVASGIDQAAHGFAQSVQSSPTTQQVGHELNQAGKAFENAFAGAGVNANAIQSAAPGQGFFEQAKAKNEPIPESAKAAAAQAHLFAAGGAFMTCGTWGGPAGAFVANVLYKDQPKHPFAQYHINQALAFQGTVFVGMVALGFVFWLLSFILGMISSLLGMIFSVLYLANFALWLGAIVMSFLQSGKAKNGEWSEYPVIGKKVMALAKPILS